MVTVYTFQKSFTNKTLCFFWNSRVYLDLLAFSKKRTPRVFFLHHRCFFGGFWLGYFSAARRGRISPLLMCRSLKRPIIVVSLGGNGFPHGWISIGSVSLWLVNRGPPGPEIYLAMIGIFVIGESFM